MQKTKQRVCFSPTVSRTSYGIARVHAINQHPEPLKRSSSLSTTEESPPPLGSGTCTPPFNPATPSTSTRVPHSQLQEAPHSRCSPLHRSTLQDAAFPSPRDPDQKHSNKESQKTHREPSHDIVAFETRLRIRSEFRRPWNVRFAAPPCTWNAFEALARLPIRATFTKKFRNARIVPATPMI